MRPPFAFGRRMDGWAEVSRATTATGDTLVLRERAGIFEIRCNGWDLMSNRAHASEERMAREALALTAGRRAPRILIGGLGMGFTLRAALDAAPMDARIEVAELIPEVVEWNRGPLGDASGRPLDDRRVRVEIADVAALMGAAGAAYDVIALDVDNGPEDFTSGGNTRLYTDAGIAAARKALRPGGVLAYWSADPDARFKARLAATGMNVEEHRVYAFGSKGTQNLIWLAQQPGK